MNMSLGREELANAIQVYLALKGLTLKGSIYIETNNGKIQDITLSNVQLLDLDIDLSILKDFVN